MIGVEVDAVGLRRKGDVAKLYLVAIRVGFVEIMNGVQSAYASLADLSNLKVSM